MDACPDFIGVVNPPEADRLPLRGVGPTGRRLELEPRLNIKTDLTGPRKRDLRFASTGKIEHFSKVSSFYLSPKTNNN